MDELEEVKVVEAGIQEESPSAEQKLADQETGEEAWIGGRRAC